MTLKLNYVLTIRFPAADLERLQAIKTRDGYLLSQGVELSEAVLELSQGSARLDFSYYGRKPDGTRHKRRTTDRINFSHGKAGRVWLFHLLDGDPVNTDAVAAFWPGES
jgi:hypothetical protein